MRVLPDGFDGNDTALRTVLDGTSYGFGRASRVALGGWRRGGPPVGRHGGYFVRCSEIPSVAKATLEEEVGTARLKPRPFKATMGRSSER